MQDSKLKIALAVHGRFYTFDLAVALLRQGHTVIVFTNYPKWAAKKFGLPNHAVRSFWLHGALNRILYWLHEKIKVPIPEAWLHKLFGRWIKKELLKESWDIVQAWSGVSEEYLRVSSNLHTLRILNRGSAHIRTQARLLKEEAERTHAHVDQPSPWMIAREEREYELADNIMVLSRFALDSFVQEKIKQKKLLLLPLGVSHEHFYAFNKAIENRCQRILENKPLRILYTGTLSFRKGMYDLAIIVAALDPKLFQFRFVGQCSKEVKKLFGTSHANIEIIPKQPQNELSTMYAWADVYVFPTIEDGFPVVLTQAQAAGLPILSTYNCCAPDIVKEGENGWLVPIRKPDLCADRLRWCNSHRSELIHMIRRIHNNENNRDWSDVAKDFVMLCENTIEERRKKAGE